MPNIKITEQDLTRGGGRAVNRDIVYIPGFPGYGEPSVSVDIPTFLRYQVTQEQSEQTAFPANGTTMFYTEEGWKYIPLGFPGMVVDSPVITTMGTSASGNGITVDDNDIEVYTPSVSATFTLNSGSEVTDGQLKIGTYTIYIPSSTGFSGTEPIKITITPKIPISAFPSEIDLVSDNTINYLIDIGSGKAFGLNSNEEYTNILNALQNTITKDYYYFNISANGVVSTINLGEDSLIDNKNMPQLCETISDFQKYFGTSPYKLPEGDDYDKSYIEAVELINRGMPVLYHVPYTPDGSDTTNNVLITHFESALTAGTEDNPSGLKLLFSKSDYDVKYITTGAYNAYNFAESDATVAGVMVDVATQRGDAFAIIDHEHGIQLSNYMPVSSENSLFSKVSTLFTENEKDVYATMFTPWYKYNASYMTSYGEYITVRGNRKRSNVYLMPPSFAYLCSLAESIKNNPNWYAIAGVNRGIVPGFNKLEVEINNTVANAMQPRDGATSINAITYIRPYGYAIWGNRTLKNNAGEGNLTATSFLNIRNMVCDIKKVIREVGMGLLFEQDTPTLWINFVAGITPTLEKMRGTGLSNYRIIRETATDKARIKATLRIYPLYAVEDIDVNIELRDEEVTVE